MATTLIPVTEDLCRVKKNGVDFSGMDFSKKKMKQSTFYQCNFDGANLSEADCEGSEFFGSSFRNTNCYRTNFKDAKLAHTIFEPKDCMGMTITLQCQTFQNMKVSQVWWFGWLFMATLMRPRPSPTRPRPEDSQNALIAVFGPELYVKLRGLFLKRDF